MPPREGDRLQTGRVIMIAAAALCFVCGLLVSAGLWEAEPDSEGAGLAILFGLFFLALAALVAFAGMRTLGGWRPVGRWGALVMAGLLASAAPVPGPSALSIALHLLVVAGTVWALLVGTRRAGAS